MNERSTFEREAGPIGSGEPDRDLEALRTVTTMDPTSLDTVLRAARRRAADEGREGFSIMVQRLTRHPVLATALAAAIVAVALLVIPVSFERTVGYDVALSLDGARVAPEQADEIARGFTAVLGGRGTSVQARTENGRVAWVVRSSASGDVRARATAFARQLTALGHAASVTATPRKETVAGNVYAYAMSQVVTISTDGKSAAELEAEIRQRLTEAGVPDVQVSVRDDGERLQQVRIKAQRQADAATTEPMPDVVLTRDGQPLGDGFQVRVMKKRDDAGALTLGVTVTDAGTATTVEVPNAGTLDDAALAAELQSRLTAAGLAVTVHVAGGEISVEKRAP